MFGSICKWIWLVPCLMQAQIPEDKQQHFVVGGIVSGVTYSVVKHKTNNKNKAFMYGVGASFVVGLGKEVIDQKQPDNRFDSIDLGATVFGGFVFSKTINVFDRKRKQQRVTN